MKLEGYSLNSLNRKDYIWFGNISPTDLSRGDIGPFSASPNVTSTLLEDFYPHHVTDSHLSAMRESSLTHGVVS